MDDLTHSLVGLASAKAGLERLSPFATTACVLAANAPDIDVVSVIGGRWALLQQHRGITHSIVGTLVLAFLIASIFYFLERAIASWRRRETRIRYRGLLLASLIAAATHPLMDWTNNYGLRPLLPWSGRWFYGDLVFIVDPYIWLILGGAAFLLTSNRRPKIIAWTALGVMVTLLIFFAPAQREAGANLAAVRAIWLAGLLLILVARVLRFDQRIGRSVAFGALVVVVAYWGALAWIHHQAYRKAIVQANQIATQRGERFIRLAAMPTVANPFRWQCVAETDRAMYRFPVTVGAENLAPAPTNSMARRDSSGVERFEKPEGRAQELVSEAADDPRVQIFLGFSRFPALRVADDNCMERTLVQFADLRYTQPGGPLRGSFSLEVTVECPSHEK